MANGLVIRQHCLRLGRLADSIPMRDALTPAPSSRSPTPRLRHARRQADARLGQLLAAIALLLRVALPGFEAPLLIGSGNSAGDFVHALCLASHEGDTEKPAKRAPAPDHHSHAACCSWHFSTGLGPVHAATLEPMAFHQSAIAFTPSAQIFPRRPTGSIGARAPPVRA